MFELGFEAQVEVTHVAMSGKGIPGRGRHGDR